MQEAAIPPLLKGDDAVILAPTAGGKTESALFPLLDRALTHGGSPGPNILYLCPLKALINNLLPRLDLLSRMIGREAFAWHGEVTSSARAAFLKDPKCVLLTTPESLQVILSKRDLNPGQIFSQLQCVVIDEVHAFCGEPRGDQLMALLQSLDIWCGRPLQRVGLSATVGNPLELLDWLSEERGCSKALVDPSKDAPKSRRKIEVHPVGKDLEECALRLAQLMKAVPKSLLFVDSRRQAEQLRELLEGHGLEALAHHSSLSQELREKSEAAFKDDKGGKSRAQVIVCTSTLELGLDVGDIDRVFQMGAPRTVSAFLQRFGRAGRRADRMAHMTFVTDREETFLQSLALIRLAVGQKVEPVLPSRRAFPVLIQQILLQILRQGALAPHKLWQAIGCPWCFSGISAEEKEAILQELLEQEWCLKGDGKLRLGERTEKTFGRSHFMELLSVFSGGQSVTVKTLDARQVGTIDAGMAQEIWAEKGAFVLGGGSWKAKAWDSRAQVLTVVPSMGGKSLRWSGAQGELSMALCREMRTILTEDAPIAFLGPQSNELLTELRRENAHLDGSRPVVYSRSGLTLETWAGTRVNRTLATSLGAWLGVDSSSNSRRVQLSCEERAFLDLLQRETLGEDFVRAGIRISTGDLPEESQIKFCRLLPTPLRREVEDEQLYDFQGAGHVVLELAGAVFPETAPI